MKKIIYSILAFSPTLALAVAANGASAADLTFLDTLTKQVGKAVGSLIPIMFALALIWFFWGLIKFIRSAGDPKEAANGKNIMIYGVIAIAVMISIYGIVFWLQNLLGISNVPTVTPPGVTGL